jgi:TfoX/Sxy family transcriptional regulator of competence genes
VSEAREAGHARLEAIAGELLELPDVAMARMFGSDGLSVRGRFFAFVSSDGRLVVKIDEHRIEALGLDNMVMRGRAMREWAALPYDDGEERWRAAAREAHDFVDSITPR